jgi:hypothetical protein
MPDARVKASCDVFITLHVTDISVIVSTQLVWVNIETLRII